MAKESGSRGPGVWARPRKARPRASAFDPPYGRKRPVNKPPCPFLGGLGISIVHEGLGFRGLGLRV